MAVSVDPVFTNVFFTFGLIPHVLEKKEGYYSPGMTARNSNSFPLVTILIPLYREPRTYIQNLSSCLLDQTYDHRKMEIIFITEPDDSETNRYVEEIVSDMKGKFSAVRVLVTDGLKKMKPYALNYAKGNCSGNIIGIYDAECEPERGQVRKAVTAILEMDYDLVQTKIEVVSNNTLGEFFKLDIYSWTENLLPVINEKARSFPLGTKGLFIRRECLDEIGWFPLHLTEDAMMAILLAERNKKFGLVDSVTKEISTKYWGTHFRQRRRWFRGYLSCLFSLRTANIPVKRKLWLSIPYISPVLCTATLFGFFFMFLYFCTWYFNPDIAFTAPWMKSALYDRVFFYWSLFLGYVGLPVTLLSYLHSIADRSLENKAVYVYMIPLYWMFVGAAAVSSFFKDTKNWDKTMRE